MSIFDSNSEVAFLFYEKVLEFFFFLSQQGVDMLCLPNESEPFGSLPWVQGEVEIVGSIPKMQQSKEFSLVCGYKHI